MRLVHPPVPHREYPHPTEPTRVKYQIERLIQHTGHGALFLAQIFDYVLLRLQKNKKKRMDGQRRTISGADLTNNK